MSDLMGPEAQDVAAKVGLAGGGGVVTLLLSRIFGGQDKVVAKLEVVQAQLQALSQQLAVATSTLERSAQDTAQLQLRVLELERCMAKQEAMVDALRHTLQGLSEGVVR